jgi:hypothetical protein
VRTQTRVMHRSRHTTAPVSRYVGPRAHRTVSLCPIELQLWTVQRGCGAPPNDVGRSRHGCGAPPNDVGCAWEVAPYGSRRAPGYVREDAQRRVEVLLHGEVLQRRCYSDSM